MRRCTPHAPPRRTLRAGRFSSFWAARGISWPYSFPQTQLRNRFVYFRTEGCVHAISKSPSLKGSIFSFDDTTFART